MDLLTVLILLAACASLGALAIGIVSMVRGGEYDQQHSTQLMFSRVGFQGIALALLLFALLVMNL